MISSSWIDVFVVKLVVSVQKGSSVPGPALLKSLMPATSIKHDASRAFVSFSMSPITVYCRILSFNSQKCDCSCQWLFSSCDFTNQSIVSLKVMASALLGG